MQRIQATVDEHHPKLARHAVGAARIEILDPRATPPRERIRCLARGTRGLRTYTKCRPVWKRGCAAARDTAAVRAPAGHLLDAGHPDCRMFAKRFALSARPVGRTRAG